ncbi:MAG: chromosomal replication initiator protein DnaA [Leptospira sp.]|jgi:chromosomal replication initiator protein|nr:MAG: chromosomal replication initiator protein DnaA [Leptospira sp.]
MNQELSNEKWNRVMDEVSKSINPSYFQSFISPLQFIKLENDSIVLSAPSDQIKRHVVTKYISHLENAFYQVMGDRYSVEIFTEVGSNNLSQLIQNKMNHDEDKLNPEMTFDNFYIADSNRLAYTACQEAVKRPGDINPLYIFGSVGVGKTHLLHAMGNEIVRRDRTKKVRYVEMTSFLNEFVYSVRQNSRTTLDSFKIKYQSYDTLLIDDIQFLNSGADKTQEEFFALFNFLYQRKSQIVIASDRPSYELPIHDRLKSRFTKGVQSLIQQPSEDLRLKILKSFSSSYNLSLDEESYQYISRNVTGDIRFLLGSINDIILYKKAYNMFIIPFEKVKEVVDSRVQTRKKSMVYTHDQLIDQVCEKFNQTRKDILGKTRKSEFIIPRHLCMFLLHEVFHLKKTQIGRIFDCQHTTVIHAITNISKLRQLDEKIESTIQNIHLQLGTNDL